MLRRTRQIIIFLGTVALLSVAALLMAVGIGRLTGQYQFVPVLSGSMAPTFRAGDAVITRPIEPGQVRVGQVLAFHPPAVVGSPFKPTDTVVHRVIKVQHVGSEIQIRTWGDANNTPDTWLAEIERGKTSVVVGYAPKLGFALLWLNLAPVRGALVGVLAFLLIAMATQTWLERGELSPEQIRRLRESPWIMKGSSPTRKG